MAFLAAQPSNPRSRRPITPGLTASDLQVIPIFDFAVLLARL
jgi:hypothetical protein